MKLLMSEISRGMLAVLFDWVRSGYTGDPFKSVYISTGPLQFECGGGGCFLVTSAESGKRNLGGSSFKARERESNF